MKKQINPTIKAHVIRSAFYLLLLLAVCAIPFALAQSRSRGTIFATHAVPANPDFAPAGVIQEQLSSVPALGSTVLASGAVDATDAAVVNESASVAASGGWLRDSRALEHRHAWSAGSLSCRWMHRWNKCLRVRRW